MSAYTAIKATSIVDRTRVTNLLETLHAAHVVVDSDCSAEAEAA